MLQVVVGRARGGDPSTVGPHHLDLESTSVAYADMAQALANRANPEDLRAARSSMLQGGQDLEITADTIVRTFATAGLSSGAYAKLAEASARVMVRYAESLEHQKLAAAA